MILMSINLRRSRRHQQGEVTIGFMVFSLLEFVCSGEISNLEPKLTLIVKFSSDKFFFFFGGKAVFLI